MRLVQREFTLADQIQFAAVSGDHNPIHLDPLQARRTQAGSPVVHGIHLLLWVLDSVAAANPRIPPLRGLRAHFNKFVFLEECVAVVITEQSPSRMRLVLSVGNAPRSKVTIDLGEKRGDSSEPGPPFPDTIPSQQTPSNLDFEQMESRSGRLPFVMSAEDAVTMFPAASNWLGTRQIAALAASSYLVGMICPGLHSIYSELRIETSADSTHEESLAFQVTEADPRFRSVQMRIAGGGLTGIVESSARLPPVQQVAMDSLVGVVASDDFAGSVALIVGGSRGLGELTAKVVAAGGGRVIITWKSGKADAERVSQEIKDGGGVCETLAYDALKPAAEQLALLADLPTHIYYFATPVIFRGQSETFSSARLDDFLAVYVRGFWHLAQTLYARCPELFIFYPSSVFVDDRPQGMTEYAMAKAAGEVLCADMTTTMSRLHVTVKRLPRMLTDQTASTVAEDAVPALETMLSVIREVQLGTGAGF